jgi:hypothetical protein
MLDDGNRYEKGRVLSRLYHIDKREGMVLRDSS